MQVHFIISKRFNIGHVLKLPKLYPRHISSSSRLIPRVHAGHQAMLGETECHIFGVIWYPYGLQHPRIQLMKLPRPRKRNLSDVSSIPLFAIKYWPSRTISYYIWRCRCISNSLVDPDDFDKIKSNLQSSHFWKILRVPSCLWRRLRKYLSSRLLIVFGKEIWRQTCSGNPKLRQKTPSRWPSLLNEIAIRLCASRGMPFRHIDFSDHRLCSRKLKASEAHQDVSLNNDRGEWIVKIRCCAKTMLEVCYVDWHMDLASIGRVISW